MDKLLERFFEYTAFDTQSKLNAKTVPSSTGQLKFARALAKELNILGFEKVTLSEHGCLTAIMPSNVDWDVPAIGFISHLDTAPD